MKLGIMSKVISPSILNSNFIDLRATIEMLNSSDADWIHLDIMDGHFVPNFTFGPPVVESIARIATKPLDVHLMIETPDKFIDAFIDAGANILTVQYEACIHLHRTLEHIRKRGIQVGVAINPHTSVWLLDEIITDIDLVLNMTVNPGFGGQSFISASFEKIKKLKQLIEKHNAKTLIEVDGGVDFSNIKKLANIGVDAFVIGSAIFQSNNPQQTLLQFKTMLKNE